MLLLVIDTSGKNGSVALARADKSGNPNRVEIIEVSGLEGGTFSAQLVPQIAAVLAHHALTKSDIDAFIVVSGPGSFTGLRVGLAAIKGLAEILRKPIVPVSLLEAIALASRAQGKIAAALDAGRGEVYAGEYEIVGESVRVVREQLLSMDEFLSLARQSAVATPNMTLAGIVRDSRLPVLAVDPVSPEMIARFGWRKLQAGETVDSEQLEANYIRRSDAELFVKRN